MDIDQTSPLWLAIHMAAAFTGALAGPAAMLAAKGGGVHRQAGRAWFWSSLVLAASCFMLGWPQGRYGLIALGVFTLYLAVSGYRSLRWRKFHKGHRRVRQLDWATTMVVVGLGVALIVGGIWAWQIPGTEGGPLAITFGIVALAFGGQDIRHFVGQGLTRSFWLQAHLSKMIGGLATSYIALGLLLAGPLPMWTVWMLPLLTSIGLIVYWRMIVWRASQAPGVTTQNLREFILSGEWRSA